jgi:hypothetical protein
MKIPYGRSDFGEIRRRGLFYVDKTPFLPLLESDEAGYSYLLFFRPRRFGKSTLLSMLEHYYDIGRKEQFDQTFKGLWIHEHPTPERSSYLVLSLDFSTVATDGGPEVLRRTFFQSVRSRVRAFLLRYRDRFQPLADIYDELGKFQEAEALLGEVMAVVSTTPYKLYVLIDEYDYFGNRLLAGGSQDLYGSIIKSTGFVRTFFATLKSGTGAGAVGRMFITGVTPLMLDDLSSGFNIISRVSQDPDLNALAGFNRADVERAVDEFLAVHPEVAKISELSDRAALLDVLERHYDGYRFSEDATERVFNSDMVLYFLSEVAKRRRYPDDMLGLNVRTEYGHLQRIGTLSGTAAAERRALLEPILIEGGLESNLVRQFGAASLSSDTQIISLLYYLGMLTFGPRAPDSATYRLEIPNRVIRALQWEHLALALKDQDHVVIDARELEAALHAMGVQGDIQPFLRLFHERVVRKIGLKDTRRLDEKTLKLMLMTYLSLSRMFHLLSEKEFAQDYCDLFLGASKSVPNARFSWLIELKYLQSGAKSAQIEAAFAEARKQVERYASNEELLPLLLDKRELKAGMIVFLGAKEVLFRPWPSEPARAKPPKDEPKAARKPAPPETPGASSSASPNAGSSTRSTSTGRRTPPR